MLRRLRHPNDSTSQGNCFKWHITGAVRRNKRSVYRRVSLQAQVVTLMAVCRTPPALSILTEMVRCPGQRVAPCSKNRTWTACEVFGGSLFEILHGTAQGTQRSSKSEIRQGPRAVLFWSSAVSEAKASRFTRGRPCNSAARRLEERSTASAAIRVV